MIYRLVIILLKFISIKNSPYHAEGVTDYYKTDISFFENKYAWKELFKYTFKYRNKIIDFENNLSY